MKGLKIFGIVLGVIIVIVVLVGFGFIIGHSHRAFFAACVAFLVVGLIGFGFIFFISSQNLACLRECFLFRSGADPRRAPAGHGHPSRLARAIKAIA